MKTILIKDIYKTYINYMYICIVVTGLTDAVLTRIWKQSVPDAERLLSFLIAHFIEQHSDLVEANYIQNH